MDVVVLLRAGYPPEQMQNEFLVPLTLAQVHAALAYYYDHQDEIQTVFAEEDRLEEELDRQQAEYV